MLKLDLAENEVEAFMALHAAADPVLAEIWDNDKDAAYDQLMVINEKMGYCQWGRGVSGWGNG